MGIPTFPASNRIDTSGHRGTGSGLGGLYCTSKAADDFPKFITHVPRLETGPRALCGFNKARAGERQITAEKKEEEEDDDESEGMALR